MTRRNGAMAAAAAALAASVGSGISANAAESRAPDPKKVQAERTVLGFLQQEVGHRWVLRHRGGRRLFPRLYNPRTGLLRNNTSVRCLRSQKSRRRGRYSASFVPADTAVTRVSTSATSGTGTDPS
jgi:hypothetical protein